MREDRGGAMVEALSALAFPGAWNVAASRSYVPGRDPGEWVPAMLRRLYPYPGGG